MVTVTYLILASLIITFALVMLIDRPYRETRMALALDVATVALGAILVLDWAICAVVVFGVLSR